MKHTELRAAVLDALEKRDTGRRFLMVAPLFLMRRIFRQLPFISPALNTRAKSWTAIPGRRSCILKFSCLLRCRIQSWMRGWSPGFYPVMSDIPALAGLITTMVTQGYEYRRDDDMALWSSADQLFHYIRDVRTIWQHKSP